MGIGGMFSKMFSGGSEKDSVAPGPPVTPEVPVASEASEAPEAPVTSDSPMPGEGVGEPAAITKETVLDQLSDIYDPEIPIDIVNLGLIYDVEIEEGKVHVQMTMTAPACPASTQIANESQMIIEEIPGVEEVWIEIVWDPPWDPSKMSRDARLSLGM